MKILFDAIEQSFEINNIYGVIEDLYSGEGTDFVQCSVCTYRSAKLTKFYDLCLPVRNEFENIKNDSIEKAIFGYLKPEILDGDNAYFCCDCDKKVKASKGSRLNKLPKILALQLQRFDLDPTTWQRRKLNDRVSFSLTLNMNHFLNEGKQSDWSQTESLISENPLSEIRPSHYKAATIK